MALDNYVQHEVFEVLLIERDSADAVVDTKFIGYATETGLSQSINKEDIQAGIGNKKIATLYNGKDVSFTITSALGTDSFLEAQAGSKFELASMVLPVIERGKIVSDGATGGKITLRSLPTTESDIVGEVRVMDDNNVAIEGEFDFTTKTVAFTDGKLVGKEVVVTYSVTKEEVEVLALNAETFPSAREIQARSFVYDRKTHEILAYQYYILPMAMPDGSIERNHQAGSNIGDSITFSALADEKGNYGYIVTEKVK